jgi:NlpC/P60 family putative phage cell wall peptidase
MSGGITRDMIVAEARGWIGTPYRHAASLRGVGCDCLGLVRGVWRALHGGEPEPVPVYAPDCVEIGAGEVLGDAATRHFRSVEIAAAGPGDLLLFRWRDHLPARHCGILTAPGRMVHAHDGAVVAEVALGAWARRIAGAYRFPGIDEPEVTP